MHVAKKGQLDIVSCGINSLSRDTNLFSLEALNRLFLKVDVIFASRTLLKEYVLLIPQNKDTRIIAAKAKEDAQSALNLAQEGKHVLALASGDALYNGFGSTIASLATKEDRVVYHPNITAFQCLFHRLGLPWADAKLFSAHSGTKFPLRAFVESPLAVIYGGTQNLVQDIAKAVIEMQKSMQNRSAIIAEKLGTQDEKIVTGALCELSEMSFDPTSLLVLLPDAYQEKAPSPAPSLAPPLAPPLALGLANSFYEKENNLITSAEVRALALSKLQLPAWGILWDMGAGSGSVGLEAAALRPYLEVHAMEQKAERLKHIEANRVKLGVHNYFAYHAKAEEMLHTLPAPDRIFIGGAGVQLSHLLKLSLEKLKPHGLLVVSAITTEAIQALYAFKQKLPSSLHAEVCRIDIAHEQKIAGQYHHLKAQNTIHLFTFKNEVLS